MIEQKIWRPVWTAVTSVRTDALRPRNARSWSLNPSLLATVAVSSCRSLVEDLPNDDSLVSAAEVRQANSERNLKNKLQISAPDWKRVHAPSSVSVENYRKIPKLYSAVFRECRVWAVRQLNYSKLFKGNSVGNKCNVKLSQVQFKWRNRCSSLKGLALCLGQVGHWFITLCDKIIFKGSRAWTGSFAISSSKS